MGSAASGSASAVLSRVRRFIGVVFLWVCGLCLFWWLVLYLSRVLFEVMSEGVFVVSGALSFEADFFEILLVGGIEFLIGTGCFDSVPVLFECLCEFFECACEVDGPGL